MRLEDITDYFKLRSFTSNPWEICRFRKRQKTGQILVVRFRDQSSLYLRGGTSDYHMFHRIFLRDEYKLGMVLPDRLKYVIDLGANVGLFSARVAPFAYRVLAYEPFVENQRLLKRNLEERTNVSIIPSAVTGSGGKMRLFMPKDKGCTGAYSGFPELRVTTESYQEVPSITLDHIFTDNMIDQCDLLKVDIEGHEYEVLHSADDDVLARILRIHSEYHDVAPHNDITRIDNFLFFLRSKDYEIEVVPHRRKTNHGMFYAKRMTLPI